MPAHKYLNLVYQADTDFVVKLFSVTGQKVNEQRMRGGSNTKGINIEGLSTGLYFYEIMRGSGILKRGNLSIIKE